MKDLLYRTVMAIAFGERDSELAKEVDEKGTDDFAAEVYSLINRTHPVACDCDKIHHPSCKRSEL